MFALTISPAMQAEWMTRCIGDVIPELSNYGGAATVVVSDKTAQEIAADCRFYMDPKSVDATAGERSAYRALLRQIETATR